MWNVIEMKTKKVLYSGETYKQCLDAMKRIKSTETLNIVVAK